MHMYICTYICTCACIYASVYVCVCGSCFEPDETRKQGSLPVEVNPKLSKPEGHATLHQQGYHTAYPRSNALKNSPFEKKCGKKPKQNTKYPRSKGLWNSISFAPSIASSLLFLTAIHFFVLTFFFFALVQFGSQLRLCVRSNETLSFLSN